MARESGEAWAIWRLLLPHVNAGAGLSCTLQRAAAPSGRQGAQLRGSVIMHTAATVGCTRERVLLLGEAEGKGQPVNLAPWLDVQPCRPPRNPQPLGLPMPACHTAAGQPAGALQFERASTGLRFDSSEWEAANASHLLQSTAAAHVQRGLHQHPM